MVETVYTVKTAAYEGPFELLLELIEKRKLFVNDISIATVTDDFLAYIQKSEDRTPSYISAFVVVAATLLLIKSRSLLPKQLRLLKNSFINIRFFSEQDILLMKFSLLLQKMSPLKLCTLQCWMY